MKLATYLISFQRQLPTPRLTYPNSLPYPSQRFPNVPLPFALDPRSPLSHLLHLSIPKGGTMLQEADVRGGVDLLGFDGGGGADLYCQSERKSEKMECVEEKKEGSRGSLSPCKRRE